MAEIEGVRINEFELKHAHVDDPVAARVSWNPAKGGGASFGTHRLQVSSTRASVVRSRGLLLFAGLFVLVGSLPLGLGIIGLLDGEEATGSLVVMALGAAFVVVGLATLSGKSLLTFDRSRGIYFRGRQPLARGRPDRTVQGPLSDIHALQLISETVSGSKGGSFTSHELNLVFADAERLNVMDHGDRAGIERSARLLADFLGVPIWQAVY